jgi:EAL domain-containing protein (putative c-di-GMP-specific phosphodiesterase class I)
MTTAPVLPTDTLLRVVLARRSRLPFRLGISAATAAISLVLTGWKPAICWFAAYTVVQAVEYLCCPRVPTGARLSPWQSALALALLFSGNAAFGALGVIQIVMAGPWGLVSACMVWYGALVHAAVGNAGSGKAVIACLLPQVAYFASIPFLMVYTDGPLLYGLATVVGGLLNGLGTLELWAVIERNLAVERRERLATYVARHDPETALSNRLAFEETIAAQIQREHILVVAVLGIDRFADLRGAIGYSLTARLIMEVALRLGSAHAGPVARLSASTLGVIFHTPDLPEARAFASRLQLAMATPIVVDGIDVDVSFTVGLAAHSGGDATSLLLEHASIALGVARKAGISLNVFESSYANLAGNLSLMSDMLRSIERGEIVNHYQPKYDLRSGRMVAVEALVRWHHPERGIVPPDDFIPLAEETGRIRELTLDVLARAIKDQAWLAGRGHPLAFAVNLSGRLLHDAEIIQTIIDIARPAAARVSIEVTETAMMAYPEKALALLGQLRSAGIGISIDDYGSGLSSLAYLKNIPADELKIDKSFITHMERNREDCLLVRSTIALAHGLGLTVVAEGVESRRTLEILGQMNCDLVQGYYMARPMPVIRLAELIESGFRLDIAGLGRSGATWPDQVLATRT